MMQKTWIIFLLPLFCAACQGENVHMQSISLQSNPPGATCTAVNDRGSWTLESTPGEIVVMPSHQELHITCKKEGYNDAYLLEHSRSGLTAAETEDFYYPGSLELTLFSQQKQIQNSQDSMDTVRNYQK